MTQDSVQLFKVIFRGIDEGREASCFAVPRVGEKVSFPNEELREVKDVQHIMFESDNGVVSPTIYVDLL